MKIIFIICASLFNSILNIKTVEYDLTYINRKRLTLLKKGTIYYLYIPAKKNQKIQISLIMNSVCIRPLSDLHVYEKKKRYDINSDNSKLYPITIKNQKNKYNISITHTVSKINSGYLSVKITPLCNIPDMNVEIIGNQNNANYQTSYP